MGCRGSLQRSANAIGSLSNGTFSQYPLPNAGSAPFWVALGSDGNVWFTERTGNRIGTITSTGEITEYPIPTAGSQPGGITAGPDGALWFTEQTGNRIGRITTAGEITEFVLPRASSGPLGITAGPDGALWFTEVGTAGNRIGRITTAGQVTEYALVFSNRQPTDITVGGDGNLWFTERAGNAVGRITPGGKIDEFVLPSSLPNPVGIAAGPDGNVWFAEFGSNNIGRIAPDGTITEFPLPNPSSQPFGIALGIDGAMWFTEAGGNRIGRIEVQVAPPPDVTPPTVTITTPADGAVFTVGQVVLADYDCADEAGGSGLATCAGPVADGDPIDTSLGTHTFTVNATDVAGNPGGATATYLVTAPPDLTPPTVTITTPADGAVFTVGQVVLADYDCADEAGGSGLATCAGPVADGDPIDTSLGTHTFTVNATDVAGNPGGATATYLVTAPPDVTPPTVTITTPADGAVFTVGQVVLADYDCADEAGGSGLATCAGPGGRRRSDRHLARDPHVHRERDRRRGEPRRSDRDVPGARRPGRFDVAGARVERRDRRKLPDRVVRSPSPDRERSGRTVDRTTEGTADMGMWSFPPCSTTR